MEYQTTSLQEVIGRVIRNTRVSDTSYIADMREWIPEAMGMIRTRYRLVPAHYDLPVHFHRTRLPGNAVKLLGVQYGGYRLPRNTKGNLPEYGERYGPSAPTVVVSLPLPTHNNTGIFIDYTSLPCHDSEWYFTELNHVTTSFREGAIRVYCKSLPVDEQGYPLIIDNEDYKSAIYWYVRSMMIGAGYPDKQFSFDHCDRKWLDHKIKAKGQINAMSVDTAEELVHKLTKLIIPESYLSDCL